MQTPTKVDFGPEGGYSPASGTGSGYSSTSCPPYQGGGGSSSGSQPSSGNDSGKQPDVTKPSSGSSCPCPCDDDTSKPGESSNSESTSGSQQDIKDPSSGCNCQRPCGSEVPQSIPNPPPQKQEKDENKLGGNFQADPVDVYSGAHTISVNLMNLFAGQKLSLTAHYNSSRLTKGVMGYGWYHNFEKHLEVFGTEIRVYENPSRYETYINCINGSTFVGTLPSKKGYFITLTGDNKYKYCLNCNEDHKEYFNGNYKLAKITTHTGFETLIDYSGDLITITDTTSGKHIYLEKNSAGLVTKVYDDDSRRALLTYANGYLINIYDVNDYSLSYSYDCSGRIKSGTDSRNIKYFEDTYDSNGRVVKQYDAESLTPTEFVYTSENTRTTKDRCGNTRIREYNKSNGLLSKVTDENGNTKEYGYDENNNVISEKDAFGNALLKEYNSFNKPTKITDRNGNTTLYKYDGVGNLRSITYPEGGASAQETFEYNSRNQVVKHTDTRGTVTQYTYDSNGMPASKKIGDKNAVLYVYEKGLLKSETDAMGSKTSYEYNSMGQMTEKTDACGFKTLYEYDKKGNLLKMTDPAGNVTLYTYDSNGQKSSSTDANGNVTKYEYNGNMKNTAVALPDGSTISYAYDGEDRMVKETDQEGNASVYVYDKAGRVISKKLADGSETKYEYDAVGNVIKETTPAGAVIVKTYDNAGNVKTAYVQDNDGNPYNDVLTCYEYDAMGRTVQMIKKVNYCNLNYTPLNTTTYEYSAAGDLLSETVSADGKAYTKSYTYDAYGNKLTEKDANGNVTTYEYDQNNNLIKVTDALSNVTENTYDKLNRLIQVKNARGAITKYGYDSLGRRTTVTDAKGKVFTTSYDANGNVLKITDPNGKTVKESTFNSLNLPATVTDPAAGTTSYVYSATGKPIKITDPLNQTKVLTYNSRGMNTSVTDPTESTSYASYDKLGNITELKGPLGAKTSYVYDCVGRLTSETTPSGGSIKYTYNAHGLMSKILNARGQAKDITYDSIGRITGYTRKEGTASFTAEFTYDLNGNILTAKDPKGTITRTFDALNRVLTYTYTYDCTTNANKKTIKYEYDPVGNLVKLTYPDGKAVDYEYDLNNNLIKVTDWAGRVTSYEYDCNNRVIKTTKPDGSITTNVYDGKQRLVSSIETTATGTVISGFEYAFDVMGRLSYEKNVAKQIEVWYTYDVLSRVIQRKTVKLSDNSEVIETYSYNSAGNLCTACGNESFRYDASNKLTEFNGKPVTYDADGNMLEASIGKFTYDSANRLTVAGTRYYVYDVEGTRIKTQKGEDTTKFVYNVNARLSQLLIKTENNADTKYVYGLGLIGEETSGNFKTYHFDYRGSTVAITNANGTVTDTFEYDTYGRLKDRTGTTKTPFLYNGRDGVITEDDTGLIYMRARYYSPELRRFINADKVHGDITNALTLNRYAYCNGEPATGVDPLGLSAERGTPWEIPAYLNGFGKALGKYSEQLLNLPSMIGTLLSWRGEIHRAVQDRIVENMARNGTTIYEEIGIMSKGVKIGRVDLVQVVEEDKAYIWEVKPNNSIGIKGGKKQLDRYLTGDYLMGEIDKSCKPKLGYDIPEDKFTFNGKYHNFEVTYRSIGNGIITYDYAPIKEETVRQKAKIPIENNADGLLLNMFIISAVVAAGAAGAFGGMANRMPKKVPLGA